MRGGCRTPPGGRRTIEPLLNALWEYPFLPLKVMADVDVTRVHYLDLYARRRRLPPSLKTRIEDYDARRKDLEVIRVLGIVPNSVIPAYLTYRTLFSRQPTLAGICRTGSPRSAAWPECRHARRGHYEKIARDGAVGSLQDQTLLGEKMDGRGLWAMVRPRTRADMKRAKAASAQAIQKADRLFIRPNHTLCILCTASKNDPLIEDNLVELRRRMEDEPDIPVTLTEGCCMVCDPCNVYHPGENLCYHAHIKNTLRDLMILERLGLRPGATLPARELYDRLYRRIRHLKEICGWRDGSDTAPFWSPCSYTTPAYPAARRRRLIARGRGTERGTTAL